MSIIEASKCSNTILERTELCVDDLASNTETPAGVTSGSATTTESSGPPPPPVPPAVPPVPGGRYTPLTPGPGTLEWGCSNKLQ